jgi:hypothetical protein
MMSKLERTLATVAAVAIASPCRAQADSASPPTASHNFWLSAGVGVGSLGGKNDLGFDGILEATYSSGPLMVIAREGAAGQIFGYTAIDQSLLAGVRTKSPHDFAYVAAGLGRARWTWSCDGPCGPIDDTPFAAAVSYEAGVEANAGLVGLGLTAFGTLGKSHARYNAIALSIQMGWLERH